MNRGSIELDKSIFDFNTKLVVDAHVMVNENRFELVSMVQEIKEHGVLVLKIMKTGKTCFSCFKTI